jgi:hypothetical protein
MQRVPPGTFQVLVIVTGLLAGAASAEAQCPPPPPLMPPEYAAFAQAGTGQLAAPENGGRRTLEATRLADGESVDVDGRLDEAVWSRATPAGDFLQIDPDNGRPAGERTEFRIAFDGDAMYLGVTAYESDPDAIIGKQRRRDEALCSDDKIRWTIDTFLDARTGYFFEMNPEGAMADALMGNTGQNRAWDGVWTGRARRSEIGWTLEVELPFRTFNFNPNSDTWGFNIERTVHHRNEVSIWMGWVRNQGLQRMANAGLVTGIRDVTQGRGLDVKPYGLFSATGSPGRGRSGFDRDANAGIDLFYNPSPTIRTNLTVNTDFAQVEVDQRQVNLTRFSLFFPERRDFFLDGATFLDFVSDTTSQNFGGGGSGDQVIPFFSRRIGLGANGTPQKIDFGTKMTGQLGRHDVGILHVRTGDDEDASMIGEDFTVARVKRRLLRQSYIGGLFTRRDARGDGLDEKSTVGVDFRLATSTFLGSQNLAMTGWGLHASRARFDASGRTSAYGLALEYPNDLWNASVGAREIQPGFEPAVGFVNRTAYRKYTPGVTFAPRPRNHPYIRRFEFGTRSEMITDLGNELLERSITFQLFEMQFHSSDNFGVELTPRYERLDEPFAISRSITLPAGNEYNYTRFQLRGQTANNRTLSVNARFETGGFYSGTRDQTVVSLNVRARPGYFLYLSSEWNQVDLDEGSFSSNVYRLTGEAQFSPFVTIVNNFQYDTQSAVLGWQSRFRWIVTPGNDVYVVYTHNWLDDPLLSRFSTLDKRFASKILYTYRF